MAVDFFFSLSGFIMCYTYKDSFLLREGGAYRNFLAKRVARIVPLNLFMLAAICIAGAFSARILGTNLFYPEQDLAFNLAANVLMLQGLGIGVNLNAPSWTISTECCAYILFPVLLAAIYRTRWLCIVSVCSAMISLFGLAIQHPHLGLPGMSAAGGLTRCLAEFALGMAAYRLYRQPKAAGFIGSEKVTAALSIGAASSLILGYDLPAALLFPLIVIAFAVDGGRLGRWLDAPVIYFLGVISYSLYLVHNMFRAPALLLLKALSPQPVGPITAIIATFLGALVVVPFACLTYAYVEKPGRSIVRGLLSLRPASSPVRRTAA
jgi:peptidoglycan/LPS O-acetylase OafA/YrhL